MKVRKPTRTESTFISNSQVKVNEGASNFQIRSGIRPINVALYDVDYAVKWHLESKISPTIVENQTILSVPIIFASGEKWTMIRKHGYLRDNQGKLLTPLIVIRRNSISKREDIQDLKVLETEDARMTFERRYTKSNKYDRFSLSGQSPVREFYSVDVPKFVQVEYELLIWTNNTQQLNEIVEQLMWWDGKAFGDTYKFITHIEPPSFETINNPGDDRIVRANMSMRTKAHILSPKGPNAPAIYKLTPVNRVQFGIEVDTVLGTTFDQAPLTQTSLAPVGSGTSSTSIAIDRLHDFNNSYSYCGTARAGSLPSAFVWTITRIFVNNDGTVTLTQAVNAAWDDRYTTNYN